MCPQLAVHQQAWAIPPRASRQWSPAAQTKTLICFSTEPLFAASLRLLSCKQVVSAANGHRLAEQNEEVKLNLEGRERESDLTSKLFGELEPLAGGDLLDLFAQSSNVSCISFATNGRKGQKHELYLVDLEGGLFSRNHPFFLIHRNLSLVLGSPAKPAEREERGHKFCHSLKAGILHIFSQAQKQKIVSKNKNNLFKSTNEANDHEKSLGGLRAAARNLCVHFRSLKLQFLKLNFKLLFEPIESYPSQTIAYLSCIGNRGRNRLARARPNNKCGASASARRPGRTYDAPAGLQRDGSPERIPTQVSSAQWKWSGRCQL